SGQRRQHRGFHALTTPRARDLHPPCIGRVVSRNSLRNCGRRREEPRNTRKTRKEEKQSSVFFRVFRVFRGSLLVAQVPRMRLSSLTMSASDLTPGEGRSTGCSPPLKIMICGMAEMRYRAATFWASSVFSLATLTLPAKSLAILSIVGASIRQGPHHT